MAEDYTLTIELGPTGAKEVYSYPIWSQVGTESSVELTDKPSQAGSSDVNTVRLLPSTMTFSLSLQDGINGKTKREQVKDLEALRSQRVSVFTRSVVKEGGFTGVVQSVNIRDSGQSDSTLEAQLSIREHTAIENVLTDAVLQSALGRELIQLPAIPAGGVLAPELPEGRNKVKVSMQCRRFALTDFQNPNSAFITTLAMDGWVSTGIGGDKDFSQRDDSAFQLMVIGAGSGALLGSTVPIAGTAAGAAIGALLGITTGLIEGTANAAYVGKVNTVDPNQYIQFGLSESRKVLLFKMKADAIDALNHITPGTNLGTDIIQGLAAAGVKSAKDLVEEGAPEEVC